MTSIASSKRASEYVFAMNLPPSARLVVARPFNHTGPGQSPRFLVPAVAARIVRAELDHHDELVVGNLEAVRDDLEAACGLAQCLVEEVVGGNHQVADIVDLDRRDGPHTGHRVERCLSRSPCVSVDIREPG